MQVRTQIIEAQFRKFTLSRVKRVLVIEDDKNLSVLIGYALLEVNPDVEVDWATSLESAMSLYVAKGAKNKKNPYDLLIVDIFLEGHGNGFDLIKIIHRMYPKTSFLIVTSLDHDVVKENLSDLQTANIIHLKKPFIYADCKSEIRNIFQIQENFQNNNEGEFYEH